MLIRKSSTVLFVWVLLLVTGCDLFNGGDDPEDSTDSTAPVITILGDNPTNIYVGDTYEDAGAQAVDDVDGQINVTSTGSVDTSVVGAYQVTYTVTDSAGNSASETRTVNVLQPEDTTGPELEAIDPENNATITDITKALKFSLHDSGAGPDLSTLKVTANGISLIDFSQYITEELVVTPDAANYWQQGVLNVHIEVSDLSGNPSVGDFSFLVQPATASLPQASPSSGGAPLTVSFTPFNTTSSAITLYEWDFDNDGNFDVSETVGRNQSYTFTMPGIHTVSLRITDAEGNQTTGVVDVDVVNNPPEVTANASPSNGSVPLTVSFSASATDNEGVALYEWDFEGDGVFDLSDASATSATHVYDTNGRFQPVLRVKDSLGTEATYSFSDIEVLVNPETYPSVELSASNGAGDAPLTVNFSASSSAAGSRSITGLEWDFDGDGIYDESTESGSITHTYSEAGTYYARVRVTDSDGQTSEDVLKIVVNMTVNLSLSTDTVDTGVGETLTVNTELGAGSNVSILIENSLGRAVRTLVPKTQRAAGSYSDDWDGKDDDGQMVAEGQYKAILIYELDGVDQRVDLSTTTGGRSYSPSRTSIPSSFEPFAGNPLEFDFTINEAAEVTAFMGNFRYGAGERLMTFMQRRPMGKGTHRITWNGEDNSGKLIELPEGETFIIGMFAYEFPDNGVYVRSGAHVSDLTGSPSLLVPDSVDRPVTTLGFELSNSADIQLIIHNAETGELVGSFDHEGLSRGSNEITWDGKNGLGIYVEPGKYRLGVTAIDANGYQSMTQYIVQQVYY